jgi:hypothetical protein
MRALVFSALFIAGCDVLFPELTPKPADGAAPADGGADGGAPTLSGTLCSLTDVRDYRTCASQRGVFRVTVEETRDQTESDSDGHFVLLLSQPLAVATVAGVDPAQAFLPTVTSVKLAGGSVTTALPVLPTTTAAQLAAQNGFALDPQRSTLLLYTVDAAGTPIAGVTATPLSPGMANAPGPFYDGPQPGEIDALSATSSRGLVAWFNLAGTTAKVRLTPPATATVAGDDYELPVRAGTVAVSLAILRAK